MKVTDKKIEETAADATAERTELIPAEPTAEQLEIAELAKPLARYLEENMIIGEVIVSMNSVALRWEGFTAKYTSGFETIEPPR